MAKIVFDNLLKPEEVNLETDPKKKLQQTATELVDKKTKEATEIATENMQSEIDAMNGNPEIANMNPMEFESQMDPGLRMADKMGRDAFTPEGNPSIEDMNRTWIGEMAKGFTRGIGQSISSTGDLVNFVAAAAPWWTMNEGTSLGNFLNEYGDEIESENMTAIRKALDEQKVTWSSFANPQFWSAQVSELIPLALEFLMAGKGFSNLGGRAAKSIAKNAGKKTLAKASQSVLQRTERLATGTKKYFDIGGKGLTKHLLRNVNGVGEATELGVSIGNALGAGIGTNLMAGAMNGMDLYKQMKLENENYAKMNNGEQLYTDDQMSEAAAATFGRNSLYLLADSLSWGITFGNLGSKLGQTLGVNRNVLKSSAETLRENSMLFAAKVGPKAKLLNASAKAGQSAFSGTAKIARKAIFEGTEEMFQETFEEWAKHKSKAMATGADYKNYIDFFASDENRATLVLSAATGGLMGGAFNIKSAFNKEADEQYKLWDRQTNLKSSIKINDETGQTMREWHIQNTLFDIAYEGKDDLFEMFMNDLIAKGQIDEDSEQKKQYEEDFREIKKDIDFANSLNVKGKMVLARETVAKRQALRAIESEKAFRDEKISEVKQQISDPVAQAKAIEKIQLDSKESINALGMKLALHEANRLNLISGKEAVPVGNRVVMSRDGRERILSPVPYTSEKTIAEAIENGYLVAGLSNEDYQEYVMMSDEELYQRAKKENEKAEKNLFGRAKDFYRKFKKEEEALEKNVEENPETETEVKVDENGNPIAENENITEILNEQEEAILNQEPQDIETAKKDFVENKIEELLNEGVSQEEAAAQAEEEFKPVEEDLKSQNEDLMKQKEAIRKKRNKNSEEDNEEDLATDYEKEAIESENFGEGKQTLAEKKIEETAKAEEEFLKKKNEDSEVDEEIDSETESEEETEEKPSYTVAKKGNGFVVLDDSGNPIKNSLGKERFFASEKRANEVISELESENKKSNRGKALLGKIGNLFRRKKKSGSNIEEETADERAERIVASNKAKANLRREMISNVYNNATIEAIIAKNPDVELEYKSRLDAYLNSTLAKWKYGPDTLHSQKALARYFKEAGFNVTPVDFINLVDVVGVEAVGYTISAGVFIDAQEWNQNETFMHEMSHIWYRTMYGTDEAKAVIAQGRKNKELVAEIEKSYEDLIIYNVQFEENGPIQQLTIDEINSLSGDEEVFFYEKAPDSDQKYINEEIFTHTLQGPLSKKYNKFFEKISENQDRVKVNTSLWAHIRNKTITLKQSEIDVQKALNNGRMVPKEDLFDFVMEGFEKALPNKNVLTTRGFAKRILKISKEKQAKLNQINEELSINLEALDSMVIKTAMKQSNIKREDVVREKFQEIIDEVNNDDELTKSQKKEKINRLYEELEDSIYGDSVFDDNDFVTMNRLKGATRLLNSYVNSFNYIKRKRYTKNPKKLPGDFKKEMLVDREDLVAEFYQIAEMTKGNSPAFIDMVKNSKIFEVSEFYNYLQKTAPDAADIILHEMAWIMGSTKSIPSIKSYNNSKGNFVLENALSEREMHWREMKIRSLKKNKKGSFFSEKEKTLYENFKSAVRRIQTRTQSQKDYLDVFKYMVPYQVHYDKILKEGTLNLKGESYSIERVINSFARNEANFDNNGDVYINDSFKSLIDSILDTNRKFTSRSVVINAEGNNITSRITNNNMTAEIDYMVEFINTPIKGKKPSFKQFKEKFGHVLPSSKRSLENPILKKLYSDIVNGKQSPSLVQYVGNNNTKSGKKTLYKNSNALTQTLEDFLIFNTGVNPKTNRKPKEYLQNMGAFADSPRKFFFSVPRLSGEQMFTPSGFSAEGKKAIQVAFEIYQDSNKNESPEKIQYKNVTEFTQGIISEMTKEIALMNENGVELEKNDAFKPLMTNGRLNANGMMAVKEFVFNNIVNGISLNEIFNPGVPSADLIKRNKGNSSPVMSHGNRNVRTNMLIVNDDLFEENKDSKIKTDSGMYILEKDAKKYINNGQLLYPLNEGLKLMGYNIERNNPNFKGQTAFIKGYTRIINEETLIKEPGLKPIYDLLVKQSAKIEEQFGELSNNLQDGSYNVINVVVPTSSIKSNLLSPEQKEMLREVTFDNLEKAYGTPEYDKYLELIEKLNKNEKDEFVGFDGYNFGPQQVMDKQKFESVTPVQMISAMIVSASEIGNLETAEEIQRLIRADMTENMDSLLRELKDLNPKDYKAFILKRLDLQAMDQVQRYKIEDAVNNLNHTALGDFVKNTLANALKFSGNKLKTAGTQSQQIPAIHYRYPNGITVNGTNKLKGFQDRVVFDEKGQRIGSYPMEIVLGKHMEGKVKARQYFTFDTKEMIDDLPKRLKMKYYDAIAIEDEAERKNAKLEIIKEYVKEKASSVHKPIKGIEYNVNDHIGSFKINGEVAGYFIRGENVLATRVPSDGPHSTGVFEVVDFASSPGNVAMVSEEFNEVIGSDYDGDALFIQHASKDTPNFNKALGLIAHSWTSPEMYNLIREKIEFKSDVEAILKKIKVGDQDKSMPSSPAHHRAAFNNTMVSKRSIGKVFNVHRLAHYFANYEVKLSKPISINGKTKKGFEDETIKGKSRVIRSAIVANIILDNSTYHYADKLGINDQTLASVMMLTNMNFSLEDIAKIMNSAAAKSWVKHSQLNQSPYLDNKKMKEIKDLVYKELGITEPKSYESISIDTSEINSLQQKAAVINLLSYLETVNKEVMSVSKIMAGHKGIEADAFILENQIKEFEDIMNNKNHNQTLQINDGFKNNPDIAAYYKNAKTILNVLKKADKKYNANTAGLIEELQKEMALFGLDESQLQGISESLEGFYTSRILGLNNISAEEKMKMKKELFNDINLYLAALNFNVNEKGNLKKQSLLFSKALAFGQVDTDIELNEDYSMLQKNFSPIKEKEYLYADPGFFNDSLTREERNIVRREFEELPAEIKQKMIVYDLLENNMTGPRSLVHIFDEYTDFNISNAGAYQQANKNKPLSKEVKMELKRLLLLNEFFRNNSQVPNVTVPAGMKFEPDNFGKIFNSAFKAKFMNREKFYLRINGVLHAYTPTASLEKLADFQKQSKNVGKEKRDKILGTLIMEEGNFKPIKTGIKMVNPDGKTKTYEQIREEINVKIKSISDVDPNLNPSGVYQAKESSRYDDMVDYMVEANIIFEEAKKKRPRGMAKRVATPKIDFHNYNDVSPLSRANFDAIQEYKENISENQKDFLYRDYLIEKEEANKLTNEINPTTVKNMTNEGLISLYSKYAEKSIYAYSIITTPIVIEIANRAAAEQQAITGKWEDGNDMGVISSFFDNNNIPSNQPATQALVRQINTAYKKFVKQRAIYINEINDVTDALYNEKFNLSDIRPIRFLQRAWHSLFGNREAIYDMLYGNIIEKETVRNDKGIQVQNFKLKSEEAVEKMYKTKLISDAEYNFYKTFKRITKEFEKYSGTKNVRKDYIPHTAMSNLEIFSSRGLLGLMVNSKSMDEAINDVKLYFDNNGKKEMVFFSDIKNVYNAMATKKGNNYDEIKMFRAYKKKAQNLLKKGINEDGSAIDFSIQNMTMADMSPMSRFANSRSVKAEMMPSMDLNKALIDYVHTTLFVNGNNEFEGFKALMPLIDGVYAYNDKKGFKNAANYAKEVIKEKLILKRDQHLFGETSDKVINGFVKGNLLYALGYKGFILGKGLYAIGNVAIGKYMNVKRDGGKTWLKGELRYWGTDEGFNIDALDRRRRAKNILRNIGFMELDVYDDVAIEKRTGLDGIFTNLALLPMSQTENWIQKAHFLGLLTDEEFNKFDENGDYKAGEEPISDQRILELEERVKLAHGKGYTPTDQSRIQTYSLGRMFMQFSRHIPSNIRERFAKDDVNIYGQKNIGSLRQMYSTASAIVSNKMSPEDFKKYYATLQPHEKEALKAAMRGMAMVTLAGFVDVAYDGQSEISPDKIAQGLNKDANIYANVEAMSYKFIPPAIRSTNAITSNIFGE